jgi:hypothetical protein
MRCPHSVGHNLQLNPAVNEYSLRVKHPHLYLQKLRIRGARMARWRRSGSHSPWRIASGDAECGRRPTTSGRLRGADAIGRQAENDLGIFTRHTANSTSLRHEAGRSDFADGEIRRRRGRERDREPRQGTDKCAGSVRSAAAERPAGSADARTRAVMRPGGQDQGGVKATRAARPATSATGGVRRPSRGSWPHPRLGSTPHEPIS